MIQTIMIVITKKILSKKFWIFLGQKLILDYFIITKSKFLHAKLFSYDLYFSTRAILQPKKWIKNFLP